MIKKILKLEKEESIKYKNFSEKNIIKNNLLMKLLKIIILPPNSNNEQMVNENEPNNFDDQPVA